eukprot:TRINITY_DN67249_c6_g2_i1.p1 TRINITY_DN67249_c6_g2~~TRINITY_DN67249_c6_g2_i1.p1  ORF type:complete len:319 (-),score=13.98 TRINITY_DN67249_c6_g2_i1:562-1518(-)
MSGRRGSDPTGYRSSPSHRIEHDVDEWSEPVAMLRALVAGKKLKALYRLRQSDGVCFAMEDNDGCISYVAINKPRYIISKHQDLSFEWGDVQTVYTDLYHDMLTDCLVHSVKVKKDTALLITDLMFNMRQTRDRILWAWAMHNAPILKTFILDCAREVAAFFLPTLHNASILSCDSAVVPIVSQIDGPEALDRVGALTLKLRPPVPPNHVRIWQTHAVAEDRNNWHVWSIWAEPPIELMEETRVLFMLHPTFTPNKVLCNQYPFGLTRTGWGYFKIRILLSISGVKYLTEHMLCFDEDVVTKLVPLNKIVWHGSTDDP